MLYNIPTEVASDDISGFGFSAGADFKLGLAMLQVVPGAYFAYETECGDLDPAGEYCFAQTTLEVPVMARYSIIPMLFVEAGPQFAFNISSTYEISGTGFSYADAESQDVEDASFMELGLSVGVGVDLPILPLTVDLKYTIGLTTLSDAEGADVKRMAIDLGVTYWFL